MIFDSLKKKTINTNFLIIFFFILINILFYFIWTDKIPTSQDAKGNLNLDNLHFFFGLLIKNLIINNEYFFMHGFEDIHSKYILGRLPLIPLFLTGIIKFLSTKFILILLIKNLIFFLLLFYTLLKISRNKFFLFISFGILVYNPHNIFTTLSLIPEEGYTSYMVLSLYLLIINIKSKKDFFLISILLALIFLTKASMTYMCYTLSVLIIIKFIKKYQLKFILLPLISLLLSYSIWASFGYFKTGKIISPLSLSTMSGSSLIVSSNTYFKGLYHLYTPDPLEELMWLKSNKELKKQDGTILDEFEINDYFLNESKKYILNNKYDFFLITLKKIYVIFFNIKKDAQFKDSNGYNTIRLSDIPNKIIFCTSFFLIFYNFLHKKFKEEDIVFFIISISFIAPYLLGWAFTRHIVPLYILAHFFLFLKIKKNF
jgi:hypothetical protein